MNRRNFLSMVAGAVGVAATVGPLSLLAKTRECDSKAYVMTAWFELNHPAFPDGFAFHVNNKSGSWQGIKRDEYPVLRSIVTEVNHAERSVTFESV